MQHAVWLPAGPQGFGPYGAHRVKSAWELNVTGALVINPLNDNQMVQIS